MTVKNRTGGVLFVTLEGPKTYYFTIPDVKEVLIVPGRTGALYHFTVPAEKTKFLILPGWYRVRAISTGCSGTFEQRKNFKHGGNLVYYCDSQ